MSVFCWTVMTINVGISTMDCDKDNKCDCDNDNKFWYINTMDCDNVNKLSDCDNDTNLLWHFLCY